ncbi:MAG TPA: T9SS type A sorting domain-containing protein, partial [Bacteroidia bacterium]|nr:T9SS type A sorting domain-containing protein [Bacteroidia bacterium]
NGTTLTAHIDSALPSYTYKWTPAASVTNTNKAVTAAYPKTTTTYTVTITTPCATYTDTVTVHVGCTISATTQTTPYFCGGEPGTASVSITNGRAPYTYTWTDGETTAEAMNLAVGSYSVTVHDSNGCSVMNTFSISSGPALLSVSASPNIIEKGNLTKLSAYLADSVSSYAYTYSWAPSASVTNPNSQSTVAKPLTTTQYTVTVSTPCGVLTDTVTVHVTCSITANLLTTYYHCPSGGDTVTVNASGGFTPYSYAWSGGQTTSTVTGLAMGNYTVTVTDSYGCGATDPFSIKVSPSVFSIYANPTTVEIGDSTFLDISSSDSLANISWSPSGSVTNPNSAFTYAHPTTTTTYTVTATTLCGVLTDTVTIFTGCSVSASVSTTPFYCTATKGTAKAIVINGIAPYAYAWSNGQTTDSVSGLNAGSYTLTVTDFHGCSSTDTFSIFKFNATISASNIVVEAGDSVFIQLSDTTSYPVSWTPAASVRNPNSVSTYVYPKVTTTYTVTISAPCGPVTDTITIFMDCTFSTVGINSSPYICASNGGTATAFPSDGVAPYTYTWSPGGQTTQDITGLNVGNYSVTVQDANGCNVTNSVTITSSSLSLSVNATPKAVTLFDSAYLYVIDNDPMATVAWSPAASVTYPDSIHTYAHPKTTTTYTLTLTSSCGILTDTVTVFMSCTNKFDQSVCIVTNDTAINKNVIIWGRSDSPPDGSFYIYDSISSGWTQIATVSDTALSEYIDTASKPNSQAYSYRISTFDSCGESALSITNSTIYLQATAIGKGDSLNWTPYVGFVPTKYKIYRGLTSNGLSVIDSVLAGVTSYVDLSPPGGSVYMIEAVNPSGGCTITHKRISHSGTIVTTVSFSNITLPIGPLGINNITNSNSLVISPNPAKGQFNISYSLLKDEDVNITLVDELGQAVYTKQLLSQHTGTLRQSVNIQDLAQGIYSLRLITDEGIIVKKVVILNR